MSRIAVAVVARSHSRTLGSCVACLRAAGVDDPAIVASGARGRNEALAACAAEVLALVEDDVAVTPGWLRALEQAWDHAADDIAVIGGPLEGPAPLGHDAGARTFHGGNVSLCAAALRGAGGFWPARGRARDWLSDEHHAQEALLASGWRASFAPEATAARIEPRGVLRARWRYGRRLAAMGGRSRGRAAREAARAAGAMLRGPTAARTGRVAENLGALLPARRDFDPVATSTPFRPSVPGRSPRRTAHRSGAIVLLYHRVAALDEDPLGLAVHPDRFAEQMEILGGRAVSLAELVAERAPGSVAITFDDGYADNVAALGRLGLPVTLFVSTGHVAQGEAFWWDQLGRLAPGPLRVSLGGRDRAWRTRDAARSALQRELQARDPDEISAALDQAGVGGVPAAEDRPMTIDELRELHAAGVTVGAHTRTHRGLAYAPEAAQRAEIERSRDDIARWLGDPPRAFSYPFGVLGADVSSTTVRLVRETGFALAVMNAPRTVQRRDDNFQIPRFAAPDLGAGAFERWLRERS